MTLFAARSERCCAAGTARQGPYFLAGHVFDSACASQAGCAPDEGDVLHVGEAQLVMARANAWTQVPAACEAELSSRDNIIVALTVDLAAAEARVASVRVALQQELGQCRNQVEALKQGNPGCGPVGGLRAHDQSLAVHGDSALLDLLPAREPGVRVRAISPPKKGVAVWQPDGLLTYFPNPGFRGEETLFYEIADAYGRVQSASIRVSVP